MQPLNLRQIASNFTILTGGEVLSKFCTFAAFMFLARVLGPESFGHLEFTLAVMVFFTLLVDFGTSPYGAREIAKQKNQVGDIISQIVPLRILMAFGSYLLLMAVAYLLFNNDTPVRRLMLIYGLTLFGIPGFLQWIFQGFEKMKLVALGSVIRQMIFAIGVFLFIRNSQQLSSIAFIECIAVGVFVLYCFTMYKLNFEPINLKINFRSVKSTVVQTLLIGLSELTWASSWYFATILLGLMVGGNVVGWFSAAHRPVMTLHTFIWLYFYNLFPSMSRCASDSEESLKNFLGNSLKFTAWAAVFIGTIGTILAGPMILLVFGPQYSETVATFSILVWLLPVTFLSGHYRYALIAANFQRYEFFACAVAALAAIILGLVLIPKFSAHGAAVALLISAIINFILAYIFVRQLICKVPIMVHLFRPLAAGGIMFLGFELLYRFNVWLAGGTAIVLYISTLVGLQPEVKRLII